MYTQMYRNGTFTDNVTFLAGAGAGPKGGHRGKGGPKGGPKDGPKGGPKGPGKRRKGPKKILKYGEKRKREYSWARDVRLMARVIGALKGLLSDDEEEEEAPVPPVIEEAPEEVLDKELHVKEVALNINVNTIAHKTDKYERTKFRSSPEEGVLRPELVVRRGKEFNIKVTFNDEYNCDLHDLEFTFTLGKNPSPMNGTLVSCYMDETGKKSDDSAEWSVRIMDTVGKDLYVGITPPCDCMIGEWNMFIVTISKMKEGEVGLQYEHEEDITVLLNPWCKDDAVYMENQSLLDEYILNDYGAVYCGNWRQIGCRPWFFAQFEDGILEICLHLIRKACGGKIKRTMSDPVKLSRYISQIVNNCDDGGALVGNWSGNYEGGKSPTHWVGSERILRQYYRSDGEPVCFGQCWVFSAVVVTVCRAIGLPCRSVTNFASAHDTDKSMTIDSVYEECEDGSLNHLPELSSDSVWNFHVWNEVWTARCDLEPGFDGWQVIDATPQEMSDGLFVCGPSPLAAIKKGLIGIGYDTAFIMAEVNSDKIRYKYDRQTEEYTKISVERDSVGRNISTKIPDGKPFNDNLSWMAFKLREDLTDCYKFKEGSDEERKAVMTANLASKDPRNIVDNPEKDVEITLVDNDHKMVGEDFEVEILVKNVCKEKEPRTVSVLQCDIEMKSYQGHSVSKVKHVVEKDIALKPDEEKSVKIKVEGKEYVDSLIEQAAMGIDVAAIVKETRRIAIKSDDFRLRRPDLELSVPDKIKKDIPFNVTVSLKNTMPKDLTGVEIDFDGVKGEGEFEVGTIKANSEWKGEFQIAVKRSGQHQISASLDSKELKDITGCICMNIDK
ncbi:hypothetical protein FSP39_008070 [Pinctada imbricata]|uniref:Transglutaminase-like domain-containing protein n=1 Tax=Pinctada imbricata TaxID=66713 RepID=A0AA88XIA4_PINIB|nr:hypothetical protein FSP39_008070 [Pinctada imbricata]